VYIVKHSPYIYTYFPFFEEENTGDPYSNPTGMERIAWLALSLIIFQLTVTILLATVGKSRLRGGVPASTGSTDQQRVALLDEMSKRTDVLLSHLAAGVHRQREFIRGRTENLLRHRGHLYFVQAQDGHVASQLNNEIRLCLRDNPDPGLLFAVTVHELAHLMETPSERKMGDSGHSIHGENFKSDERWLMAESVKLGLTSQAGYIGRRFCGINLPDPLESS